MPTSNSTDWTLTRDQLITAALRKLGVLYEGQSANATQISDAATALNAMIKAFQADGMPLWKISESTITTVAGQRDYSISNSVTLPLKVIQAYRTEVGGTNVPLNIYTRFDFNLLPLTPSTITGTPVTLYYNPQMDSGTVRLWPIPDDSTTTFTVVYQAPYEDMDTATDNFSFPSYWMEALIYNLAYRLAPEYGIPLADRAEIKLMAKESKDLALSFGTEEGSVQIKPAINGRR